MNVPRACPNWLFGLVSLLTLMSVWPVRAQSEPREIPTTGFRVEWTSGTPKAWQGEWRCLNGQIDRFRSLGTGLDDPGTAWMEGDVLHVQRRSPRLADAIDLWVTATLDAPLQLSFPSPREPGAIVQITLRLKEIAFRPREISLGPAEKIRISRVRGDSLRCAIDRPHVIFHPGETWQPRVQINVIKSRRRPLAATLQWEVHAARETKALVSGSSPIQSATNLQHPAEIPLSFSVPETEGVYELKLSLTGRNLEVLETRVQFLVLSDKAASQANRPLSDGTLIESIDPQAASAKQRLTSWNGMTSPDRGGHLRFPWRKPDASEPSGSPDAGQYNWTAFRLKIAHPHRPHRLVLSIPTGELRELGVALLPANGQSQLQPMTTGLDAAVVLPRTVGVQKPDSDGKRLCEWLCWPGAEDSVLVVHGLQNSQPVQISQIKLYELEEHLPPTSHAQATGGANRLIGPYLSKPTLLRAPTSPSASHENHAESWESLLQAAERLIEITRYQGENSILVAVTADGSCIYPSALLEPTPRYDHGELAGEQQDPRRKDVLELLFRLCDRAGVVLIPELQFESPLPALEQQLRSQSVSAEGILLRNRNGHIPSAGHPSPRYNVLDPRVQQSVREVVRELTDRYRQHASFSGVALQLSPSGCLQLPGAEWGCDRQTVGRYALHSGKLISEGKEVDGPTTVHLKNLLAEPARRAEWLTWRCNEVATLHRQLAADIAAAKAGSYVFMSGTPFTIPTESSEFPQRRMATVREILRGNGLDFGQYSDKDAIVLLQPAEGTTSVSSDQRISQIERMSYFRPTAENPNTVRHGRVVNSSSLQVKLRGAPRPLGPDPTAELTPSLIVAGSLTQKPYASALASGDVLALFHAAPSMTFWRDDAVREMRRGLTSLPAIPFENALPRTLQPLIARSASRHGKTFLYVVNEADLPLHVTLQLDCSPNSHVTSLGNSKQIPLEDATAQRSRLTFDLGGHDLWCVQVDVADVRISDASIVASAEGVTRLREQIDNLHSRLADIEKSRTVDAELPENPGFEKHPLENGAIPGWQLPEGNSAGWHIDRENPHGGQSSLRLSGGRNGPRLLSDLVTIEHSRPLLATLWIKGGKPVSRVNLAWHVEGQTELQQTQVTVGQEWERCVVTGTRLPVGRNARLIVEPLDEGDVWIDDVHFQTSNYSTHELRQATKVLSALNLACEESRYSDCQRMLDGHWARLLLDYSPDRQPSPQSRKIRFADRPNPIRRR